jgi:hypothetical protein
MPFVAVGLQSITGEHDDVQPSEGVTVQIVRHSDVVVVSHSSSSGPGGTGGGLIPSQKRHGIQSKQDPAHHMSPKHQNLGISNLTQNIWRLEQCFKSLLVSRATTRETSEVGKSPLRILTLQ